MTMTAECHVCGADAKLISTPFEVHIGNRVATVDAERMRCESCGEEFFLPGQMDAAQRLGAAAMRAAEGLLAPEEIRSWREARGLTQSQLEHLLGVGPKTVVRWERGTVFPNASTDGLLRVLRDVPGVFQYLAKSRGVELPKAPQPIAPPLSFNQLRTVALFLGEPSPSSEPIDDPKIVSLASYRTRKTQPIPPDLLSEARL